MYKNEKYLFIRNRRRYSKSGKATLAQVESKYTLSDVIKNKLK